MTDQDQTNAMADILGKLNNIEAGVPNAKRENGGANGNEIDAMADVLRKLKAATGDTTSALIAESANNPELDAAVNTTRTNNGVSVSRYDICTEKKTIQEGLSKTFYYIVDNKTNQIMYDDLGLFESAMGIVKHELYTNNQTKIQRILDLDREYIGNMMETYSYKRKLKTINENSTKFDVTSAKYSNSKSRLQSTKMKLLKAI